MTNIEQFNRIFKPGQEVSAIRGDGKQITGRIEGDPGNMAFTRNFQDVVIIDGETVAIKDVRAI